MRRLLAGACLAAAAMTVAAGCLSRPGPVTVEGAGTRYAVTLTVVGDDTADIVVERGEAESVVVVATMPQMGHVTPETAALRSGPGRFRADGGLFTMDGVWEVSVRLSGAAGEEVIPLTVLVTS
ncbi:hypothetical protein FXF51_55065 [Nonomuraea sp. PA05]|uniref:hypothetical protein n=1 Tax=Nonomuraea sp. PA05 TaxID=2604466 RepID=UPI0011D973B6|nr:hypothetical protein [Nonomuraea sp. PA05]TYB50863.1 hypothetical protein FXF51_55065 [Nonomuraea sp. PA05]